MLARLVKKFGGTSVGDPDRIRAAAAKVAEARAGGNEVAVVVSAMAGMTNQLAGYCRDAVKPGARPTTDDFRDEYDVVVSTGEQVTAGLMAMALRAQGVAARSWTGWQIPIRTDGAHGAARVTGIKADVLLACLKAGSVPVVAGFQGVTIDARVATLGVSGSDLTAVEIAHAIGADRCDIYTDVPGIYTADPNMVKDARKLHQLTYSEMQEMARHGARVMQAAAVESAAKNGVAVRILSSFDRQQGTVLVPDGQSARTIPVCGMTYQAGGDAGTITISIIRTVGNGEAGLQDVALAVLADAGVQDLGRGEDDVRAWFDVAEVDLELAMRALHSAYGLDKE